MTEIDNHPGRQVDAAREAFGVVREADDRN